MTPPPPCLTVRFTPYALGNSFSVLRILFRCFEDDPDVSVKFRMDLCNIIFPAGFFSMNWSGFVWFLADCWIMNSELNMLCFTQPLKMISALFLRFFLFLFFGGFQHFCLMFFPFVDDGSSCTTVESQSCRNVFVTLSDWHFAFVLKVFVLKVLLCQKVLWFIDLADLISHKMKKKTYFSHFKANVAHIIAARCMETRVKSVRMSQIPRTRQCYRALQTSASVCQWKNWGGAWRRKTKRRSSVLIKHFI